MTERIVNHTDLIVYQRAFDAAMQIFELSKAFPGEERFSLTDQMRRSSRSVCANIAEGWRKRRYEAMFINKLSDAEAEAAETQVWLDFAIKCSYIDEATHQQLYDTYIAILRTLTGMIHHPETWVLRRKE